MLANINCNPLQTALKFKTVIESRHILSLSISNYTVIPSFDFCSLNFDWIWPSLHLNIHSIPCHRPKSKCFSHLVPTMVECWHLTSWCCDKQQKFLQSVIGFISAIIDRTSTVTLAKGDQKQWLCPSCWRWKSIYNILYSWS